MKIENEEAGAPSKTTDQAARAPTTEAGKGNNEARATTAEAGEVKKEAKAPTERASTGTEGMDLDSDDF